MKFKVGDIVKVIPDTIYDSQVGQVGKVRYNNKFLSDACYINFKNGTTGFLYTYEIEFASDSEALQYKLTN